MNDTLNRHRRAPLPRGQGIEMKTEYIFPTVLIVLDVNAGCEISERIKCVYQESEAAK